MFRLRGKRHLLTYSDVDDTWDHLSIFNHLDGYAPIERCIIARELHQSGKPHFHVFVEWKNTLNRALTDQLDINGKHPNILAKRTTSEIRNAQNYVRKDSDWIEYGDFPQDVDSNDNCDDGLIATAMSCESWEAFLEWGYENRVPYQYVSAAWNAINNVTTNTYLDGFNYNGEINDPDLDELTFDPNDTRCIIVCGPSGIGKTTWAINNMPRPSLLLSTIDDLRALRPDYHKSVIFDDFSALGDPIDGKGKWPIQAQIHLCDWHQARSIKLRYRNVIIPANMYKCFTCNPGRWPVDLSDPAIQRRVVLYEYN